MLAHRPVRIRVLLYHDVGLAVPGVTSDLTVANQDFAQQVRWLSEHRYSTLRLQDFLEWKERGKVLPPKSILITLDDGYQGIAQNALPLLQQYGFTAVVFVVTSRVGGTNQWDEEKGLPRSTLISAEEIRTWSQRGIEFGSHSRTHTDLTRISGRDLENEIAGSRHELAAILGAPPIAFAYPGGSFDRTVQNRVREYFKLGFTSLHGFNMSNTDPHAIRRTVVSPRDTIHDFRWRMLLAFSPRDKLSRIIHNRLGTQPRPALSEPAPGNVR